MIYMTRAKGENYGKSILHEEIKPIFNLCSER